MALTPVTVYTHALLTEEDAAGYVLKDETAAPASDPEQSMFRGTINAVTDAIEEYTRRKWVARTITEYYDGHGEHRLTLRYHPINSITSIEWLNSTTAEVLNAYASGDWDTDDEHGFLRLLTGDRFFRGRRNWRIVWKPGYTDIASVPAPVFQAAKMLFAYWWREFDQYEQAVEETNIRGQKTVRDRGLPQAVKSKLEPYRSPLAGHI